ncbi:divalent-cation tolerance protein CutA [Hyphomicrobium sp. 99]|uniref:divalent-cation tolerance protein CutA n=1 Tax=Hyphomicrobium sp. 99 TaxID=1163419 RepID=UPI001FD99466|nr:divalent-cation tolerance protein CutA [Hyphomicrobium sp. 99]
MSTNDKPPTRDTGEPTAPPAVDVVMIYATFPDRQAALALGREMVEQGLAGCINVLPSMTSVYVWKGETETAEEAVLIAKLAREGADRAVAHIIANHPYETPAVLVIPVMGGSSDYLTWIMNGTQRV